MQQVFEQLGRIRPIRAVGSDWSAPDRSFRSA